MTVAASVVTHVNYIIVTGEYLHAVFKSIFLWNLMLQAVRMFVLLTVVYYFLAHNMIVQTVVFYLQQIPFVGPVQGGLFGPYIQVFCLFFIM